MSDDAAPPPPPPAPEPSPVPPPPEPTPSGDTLPLGAGKLSAADDKLYCILAQFFSFIIWPWKKDESPAVDKSGKEALNFLITVLIPQIGIMLISSIPALGQILGCLLAPISLLIGLAGLVLAIIGALKTSDGYFYKYPVNLRLLK